MGLGGQGFPGSKGARILGPQGDPVQSAQQRDMSKSELPEGLAMQVLVKSPCLDKYSSEQEPLKVFPVSIQCAGGMLQLSEAYFWHKDVLRCFRQLQVFSVDWAVITVPTPKWWNMDQLKKAKLVDE